MYKYQHILEEIPELTAEKFEFLMEKLETGIVKEMVQYYGKSVEEAQNIVALFDIWDVVSQDPYALGETPSYWASAILVSMNDLEAIEYSLATH